MKLEEPYEGRPSRTVLWEPKGEIPLGDPIGGHSKIPAATEKHWYFDETDPKFCIFET